MKNNQKQCKLALNLYVNYAQKMTVLLNTFVKKIELQISLQNVFINTSSDLLWQS